MDSYYNNITNYNELYGEEQRNKLRIIKELFLDAKTVLDVGCGTMISKEFFTNVVGIDPSEKLLPKEGIIGTAESLPFTDNSFDLVICVTAFHHVPDKEKAINEIKRVSKGNICITLLKKSSQLEHMKELIKKEILNIKEIEEEKDTILYAQK